MKDDNETVEQVCKLMVKEYDHHRLSMDEIRDFKDEILSAHKREIAERDGERKGLLKANESFAADNTRLRGEIAEKDEERLTIVANYEAVVAYKDRQIASLRALVKELADALASINKSADFDPYIGGKWTIDDEVFMSMHIGALVAKAREVVK